MPQTLFTPARTPWGAGRDAVEVLTRHSARGGPLPRPGIWRATVVEPDAAVRRVVVGMLSLTGVEATGYADLEDAVLDDVPSDLLVLEPRGPQVDEEDLLRRWRADRDGAPVIWCTAVHPSLDRLHAAAASGLCAVAMKPLDAASFLPLVARVCRDAERRRRLDRAGIDCSALPPVLPPPLTRTWLGVELEMAGDDSRPLALVVVAPCADAAPLVRSCIRGTDVLALADADALLVLLPDVDRDGAARVASRIRAVLRLVGGAADVWPVQPRDDEDCAGLVDRVLRLCTRRECA